MGNRRNFSSEFKARAVDLVVSQGLSVVSVAKELEISGTALSNWVKAWKLEHPNYDPGKG